MLRRDWSSDVCSSDLVRPRKYNLPDLIGSVFLDRGTSSIVRMNFTFTPASYVDPYLDYIRISLDNSLWEGKYWLPYRQEAELRRELPELDFMAGSIIRGRYGIGGHEFHAQNANPEPPGPRLTAPPPEELGACPGSAERCAGEGARSSGAPCS